MTTAECFRGEVWHIRRRTVLGVWGSLERLRLVGSLVVHGEDRSAVQAALRLCCASLRRLELRDVSPQDAMALLLRCGPELQRLTELAIRGHARSRQAAVFDWGTVSLPGLQSLSVCYDRWPYDAWFPLPAVSGFDSFLDRHPALAALTSDIAELWTEARLLRLLHSTPLLHSWTAARVDLSDLGRAIDLAEAAAAATAAEGSSGPPPALTLLPRLSALSLELDITNAAQQTVVTDCTTLLALLSRRCSASLQRLSLGLNNSSAWSAEWTVYSAAPIPAHRLSACGQLRSLRLDSLFSHALLQAERLQGAESWPLLQRLELSLIDPSLPVSRMEAVLRGWTSLQDVSIRVLGAGCCMRAVQLLAVIGRQCLNAERVQLTACEPSAFPGAARDRPYYLPPARPCLHLADVQALIHSQALPESAFSCLRSLELKFDIDTRVTAGVPPPVWELLRRSWLASAPLHSLTSPVLDEADSAREPSGFMHRRWQPRHGSADKDSRSHASCGCCVA